MSKTLITLSALVLAVVSYAAPSLNLIDEPMFMDTTTIPKLPGVSDACNDEIQSAFKTCNTTIAAKVLQSKTAHEMIEATTKGDQAKITQLQTKLMCCSAWSVFD